MFSALVSRGAVLLLLICSLPIFSGQALAGSECDAKPKIEYLLGPKIDIDELYPFIKTDSMSYYDYSMAMAANIQYYLQNSLNRDLIDNCYLKVTPAGDEGYQVSFRSSSPKAASYGKQQAAWLTVGERALWGVQRCQRNKSCWEPTGTDPSGKELKCVGPWQFYLPLGLPMVSQNMVMLLHYPPYTAMQQSDYLNNATLDRWQRLLVTVGVPQAEWTRYTTTVDIFPIAAPGSGQSGCFASSTARNYFGAPGSGYIPAMLDRLLITPEMPGVQSTIPVIIFGAEAISYWNATYPETPTKVLQAGSAKIDPAHPEKTTPFMGANHPIAAVYQTCESTPGIETMVKQDLTTACFAKSLAASPGADPVAVKNSCESSYFSNETEYASQVCITAVIDKSPQFAQWSHEQAKAWCDAHSNKVCPLPDYK